MRRDLPGEAAQRLGFSLDEVAHLLEVGRHRHGRRVDAGLQEQARVKLMEDEHHPVNDRDTLLSVDRIHFSSSGQAVMAAEVVKALAGRVPPS